MNPASFPKLYFENAVGRVLEHADGYVIFEYKPGPRQLSDLQALLTHTRNLFERNQWNHLLGDQRKMAPFTNEESTWIVDHWLVGSPQGLYGAILVTAEAFAALSAEQAQQERHVPGLAYRIFDREEPLRSPAATVRAISQEGGYLFHPTRGCSAGLLYGFKPGLRLPYGAEHAHLELVTQAHLHGFRGESS
jgi:hypothetical protein